MKIKSLFENTKNQIYNHKIVYVFIFLSILLLTFIVCLALLICGLIKWWVLLCVLLVVFLVVGSLILLLNFINAIFIELGKKDERYLILSKNIGYFLLFIIALLMGFFYPYESIGYEKAVTSMQILWTIHGVTACIFFSCIFNYQKNIKKKLKKEFADKKQKEENIESVNSFVRRLSWSIFYFIMGLVFSVLASVSVLLYPTGLNNAPVFIVYAAILTLGSNLAVSLTALISVISDNMDLLYKGYNHKKKKHEHSDTNSLAGISNQNKPFNNKNTEEKGAAASIDDGEKREEKAKDKKK